MLASEYFQKDYLIKSDFEGESGLLHPILFPITSYRLGTMRISGTQRNVVHLESEEVGKEFAIKNVVNETRVVAMLGDEMDRWPGRTLRLFWDPGVKGSSGKTVGGCRIDISYKDGKGE